MCIDKLSKAKVFQLALFLFLPFSTYADDSSQLKWTICRPADGVCKPLFKAGVSLPASYGMTLTNSDDNVEEIGLTIYQGEAKLPDENKLVARFTLPVSPKKAGEVTLQVVFVIDRSKKLTIRTYEMGSAVKDEFFAGLVE